MLDYDPELPGGFQDADFEMAELTAAGNRSAALKRKGICDHGWLRGDNNRIICNYCEKSFDNHEQAYLEGRAIRNGDYDLNPDGSISVYY